MAKNPNEEIVNLLQVIAIVQLTQEGVPQLEIQKVLGVDMNRVNRLAQLVRKKESYAPVRSKVNKENS